MEKRKVDGTIHPQEKGTKNKKDFQKDILAPSFLWQDIIVLWIFVKVVKDKG